MNAPLLPDHLLPERLLRPADAPPPAQADLPLASAGVQRTVWDSRFGPMLIEVVDGQIFVNGQLVQPHRP